MVFWVQSQRWQDCRSVELRRIILLRFHVASKSCLLTGPGMWNVIRLINILGEMISPFSVREELVYLSILSAFEPCLGHT